MTTTPHDALFKATFTQIEHAAAALRSVLPPHLAERIDFGTLTLRPGSFIDEELAASHSDILYSAVLAGRPILIYLLYEHQSTFVALMAFRLLRYMMRIWELHLANHPNARRLPAILPVVLHHSEKGWQGSVAFEDILDLDPEALAVLAEHVPRFRFVLDDISAEPDDALKARAMTALGRLVLWCFRHARRPEDLVDRLASWMDIVREIRRTPNGGAALALVWRYILAIAERRRPEELLPRLVRAAGREVEEEIVTAADYLREEGRLEGRIEGQRSILLKQLRSRFGVLPEAVVHQVHTADALRLDGWTDRVLTAATLAEVLGEA